MAKPFTSGHIAAVGNTEMDMAYRGMTDTYRMMTDRRKWPAWTITLLLLLSHFACRISSHADYGADVPITGHLTDASTGIPIQAGKVSLVPRDRNEKTSVALSDENGVIDGGFFAVWGGDSKIDPMELPFPTLTFLVEKDGFEPITVTRTFSRPPVAVDLGPLQMRPSGLLPLDAGG